MNVVLKREQKMILRIGIKSVLYFSVSILIIGCFDYRGQEANTLKISPDRLIIRIQDVYIKDSLEYGEIIYKSDVMDTITLKKNDKRYLWFHYGFYDRPMNVEELKGNTIDSYKAINDSVIPFDSKYDKTGEYYLEGYLEEVYLLPDFYPNGGMRKYERFIKISKKIRVVDEY